MEYCLQYKKRIAEIKVNIMLLLLFSAVLSASGPSAHAESWFDFGDENVQETKNDQFKDDSDGETQEPADIPPIDKITEKAVEKAAENAVEKATERAAEKAAEKVAEKAAEHTAEIAAAKAVEKAAAKAAAKAAEKDELKAKRPREWRGATTVYFAVFVLDIDEIDDAAQNFTTNVFIRLRWKDPRLAIPGGDVRQIPLEEVWNPRVIIANRQGLVSKSLPDVVEVRPDGTVNYLQRYTGKLSQRLRLTDFPLDQHLFSIHFVSTGYSEDEIIFKPEKSRNLIGGSIAGELSLQDWKVTHFEALTLSYMPIKQIKAPGFAFRFTAERYVSYYLWQVVIPLIVVVVMSWAAFFINGKHVGVRFGVATSAILTIVTLRFVISNLLPRLPYMTRMDFFTVGSTLLVFLALIAVVLTSFLDGLHKEGIAKKIDMGARFLFPISYLVMLIWFVAS